MQSADSLPISFPVNVTLYLYHMSLVVYVSVPFTWQNEHLLMHFQAGNKTRGSSEAKSRMPQSRRRYLQPTKN